MALRVPVKQALHLEVLFIVRTIVKDYNVKVRQTYVTAYINLKYSFSYILQCRILS